MALTVHKISLFVTEVISVQDGCVHVVKQAARTLFSPFMLQRSPGLPQWEEPMGQPLVANECHQW